MDADVKQKIEDAIRSNHVLLYMKGTPSFPQCGFSHQAVQVLRHYGVEFASVNVLEDMAIREGIKEYSDWPTIPQLYVDGEFIGGCDILLEMHSRGELPALFDKPAPASA